MISLLQWSKREHISYSYAQKLLAEDRIEGAVRTGARIIVPIETHAPIRPLLSCRVCGEMFPQITGTHIKTHKMTMTEYKAAYPEARTISEDILEIISSANIGRVNSEEQLAAMAAGRAKMDPAKRRQAGRHKASDATRAKMSLAQQGRKHTQETKNKIGDAHRGKKLSVRQIEGLRANTLAYYKDHAHPFKGKHHTVETCLRMAAGATVRESNYSAERVAELAENRAKKTRGRKRTEEQKQRYRECTIQRICEKPWTMRNTAGERTIDAWVIEKNIRYKRQYRIPGVNHPWDFYLEDYHTLVEFDGAHHWFAPWFNVAGKTDQEKDQQLADQREKDAVLNLQAGQRGYRVLRVYGRMDVGDCKQMPFSLEEQLAQQGFEIDTLHPENWRLV